jgi:hypothetical protein
MTYLKGILGELLVALLAVLAATAFGYTQGAKHNEQKWLVNQAKVERSARADYDDQARRGEVAAAQYLKDTRALTGQFNDLTEKFNVLRKRTPLVVARAGGPACAQRVLAPNASSAPVVPGSPTQPGMASRPDSPAPDIAPVPGDSSPVLTAGAVWMWNSALTGTDQPSGACGAADPTAAACVAATTATVDDAWDNHIANAQACAANRLAHQRLIDFVQTQNARKAPPSTNHTTP